MAGLEVPSTGRVSENVRVLWIERFDRVAAADPSRAARRKLHQEDFCQVLGKEPESKYEREGGPGVRACATVIRQYSSLPATDLPRMVQWAGFNYLIGNEDAHAKNLALLYTEDGLRLTPHYDLVSTEVYPGLERRLAMKIGRSWDIRNVQRSDWKLLAGHVGLPWDTIRSILLELAERVMAETPEVMKHCEEDFGAANVYSMIAKAIGGHAAQLLRELTGRVTVSD